MRKSTLQSLISAVLLVIAPLPKDIARPATVGAWQVVAQLSTLFVAPGRAREFLHQVVLFVSAARRGD